MPTILKIFGEANSENRFCFELEQISDMTRNFSVNGLQSTSYDLLKPSTKRSDENVVIVECEEKVQKDRLFEKISKGFEQKLASFGLKTPFNVQMGSQMATSKIAKAESG